MKNILAIIRKEFRRFFKDYRLVFSTILLPGIMIFSIYTFIGFINENISSIDDDYTFNIYSVNAPNFFMVGLESINHDLKNADNINESKESVSIGESDILVVFEENFESLIENFDFSDTSQVAPQVDIFYNSTRTESAEIYMIINSILDSYEKTVINRINVNNNPNIIYDLATDRDITGLLFSSLFPLLIMAFLLSSSIGVAPESFAGEKERGTLSTMLVTPIKRSELAIGKIVSLSFISLLGGISAFIGVIFSLSNVIGGDISMDGALYNMTDYLSILFVILSTVVLFVSIVSIVSVISKSVKEANTLMSPLMILIIVIAFSSSILDSVSTQLLYLIPVLNVSYILNSIFLFEYSYTSILLVVLSNLFTAILIMYVISKMLSSEKIIFSK